MAKTEQAPRTEIRAHMAPWLDRFASGRLESALQVAVEAHLLTCDACFAAYVALLVRRG